jgi:hypothetical protein
MFIDNLVAFTATEFQYALVTPFLVDFTHRILIEGFNVVPSMKHILTAIAQSSIARHTNVVLMHLNTATSSIASTLYVFTHPKWRPWGQRLPPACSVCASPHSWSDEIRKGSTYSFICRYPKCTGTCSFDRLSGFKLFMPDMSAGRWMKKEYVL